MNIRYTYKAGEQFNKEELLNEAKLGLQEVINKARINKNVQKWLDNKEITDVEVEIVSYFNDCRIYYNFNNKVVGYGKYCGGNSLDYFKISFCKKWR